MRNDADGVGMMRAGYHCEGRGLAWPGALAPRGLWRWMDGDAGVMVMVDGMYWTRSGKGQMSVVCGEGRTFFPMIDSRRD